MQQFSSPHLAALAVLAIFGPGSVYLARRAPRPVVIAYARGVALLIAAGWAGEYLADIVNGTWSIRYDLPLQLTDAVSVTAAIALWTRRRLAIELTFFWSLTASLQAILTPDLGQSFPSIYYFTYFLYHIGAVVAGCMLVFGCGRYPRPRAAWRTFAATLAFAAVSGTADLITGGNYMYLRAHPEHNSLLSVMGPWPWYLVGAGLVGLAMLLVLQWIADFVGRRDRHAQPSPLRPLVKADVTGPVLASSERRAEGGNRRGERQ
jgi:hypothetical integral membrane protein (TIGR02206 family)